MYFVRQVLITTKLDRKQVEDLTAKLQDSRAKPPVLVRIIADDQNFETLFSRSSHLIWGNVANYQDTDPTQYGGLSVGPLNTLLQQTWPTRRIS